MEVKHKHEQKLPHPQLKSNFLSNLFFCWTIPIFKIGLKRELCEDDFYQILKKHESGRLGKTLEDYWDKQIELGIQPSLWKAIWKLFKSDILTTAALLFSSELVIKMSRPLALGKLMGYYTSEQSNVSKNDTIIYGFIIILASFLEPVLVQTYIIQCEQIELKAKVAISSLIYRKSLRLSKSALNQTTVGHIINLLSTDMTELVQFAGTFNAIWSAPLEAIIILYLLYVLTGPTALVGIIFLVILIPIQFFMSKKSAVYRLKIALKTDERIRYMSEIISGIQVIKLYAWEKPFIKLIDAVRRKEVAFIKTANYLNGLTSSFAYFIDRVAIFLCILTYVLTGSAPLAQYVFLVSSLYKMLMVMVSFYLPHAVSHVLKAKVSVMRIESFLNLEEIQYQNKNSKTPGIKIDKAEAKWSQTSIHSTLTNINFEAHLNETVAIIGPIGSGKSSLLQLCLSEIPLLEGSVHIGGVVSYANQEPWLFAGTIKQNILFGHPMIRDKYHEVIKVCALDEDIVQFPYGDNTIVGERGVLLSGGQKARIGLARAIYKDADIYLLDDPLSAVDASVGKQIFNNCICGYLKNKCTILVTHQIQYLASVDRIYLLENGAICASGSYQELQESGEHFAELLNNTEKHERSENAETFVVPTEIKDREEQEENKETWVSGKVATKVYGSYLIASGTYFTCFITVLLFALTELLATGSDYFLSFWVNLEQDRNNTASTSFFTKEICVYIYSGVIGTLIVLSIIRSMFFIKGCMRASVRLHNKMFSSIVSATMLFFHTNSSGRILNRFAEDIGSLDSALPGILMDSIQLILSGLGTVLAICIVSPWTIIPTFLICTLMYFIRMVFLASSRSIKRIESTNRSPIFAHLTESMKGLTTIRAFGARQILQREFDNYQNVHSSIFYTFLGCGRAFGVWLDCVCVLYVFFVTIIALANETYGGNVGFVITQAMSLTGMFQWAIKQCSELENQMTSVERVVEYIEVDQESDEQAKEAPESWPTKGAIEFKSVFMKYTPDCHVLKNLNLLINSQEKIGIVGRTGAGKSSLISVLFRLMTFEGDILIDGINTKSIPLSSLRSKISIIPQEPFLFSGSVRKNLDPFDKYPDEKIWDVLEQVKLKEFVTNLHLGLHSSLSEGGSNFSVGQKQLICLARALLSNNRILLLDEATANVDPQTDELLQKTVRDNFRDCTVLTIAHRLHTVMDSDKILVMDDGCAVEFDHPFKLLENKGVFYQLVMETGNKMVENLLEVARKNFVKHKKIE